MHKNFEIKFNTSMQFLLGWKREPTGVNSTIHGFYFGPWTLTIILHHGE